MFKTKGCEVNGFLNNDVQENCTIGKIIERLSIVQSWSADVLSGRRFVMTAVRRFARTALDVLSGRTCLRRFVRIGQYLGTTLALHSQYFGTIWAFYIIQVKGSSLNEA